MTYGSREICSGHAVAQDGIPIFERESATFVVFRLSCFKPRGAVGWICEERLPAPLSASIGRSAGRTIRSGAEAESHYD